MKKYLFFLALVFLLTRVSNASAIMIDYKSKTITPEELLVIADNISSSGAMTIKVSLESDYYYNNFESLVLEIVNEILEYPPYPPLATNDLNGTATNPVAEPSTIVLMGLGLMCLARVGRKQFKEWYIHVSSIKMALKSASITV